MSWQRPVSSVNVESVGWRPTEMLVVWKQGTTSAYAGVPEHVAQAVASAPDIGPAINEMIKPYYAHRYVG